MPSVKQHHNGHAHLEALRAIGEFSLEDVNRWMEENDDVWWAERHLRTDKGTRLDFEQRPYLELIYRDWHPHIIYKKGAQIGITQAAIGRLIRLGIKKKINSIYIFPTATQVEEFSQSRFKPIVESSPMIKELLGINNAHYKEIGESKVFFKGSFSEHQALSQPSDLNVIDEYDFCKDDIKEQYVKRLTDSTLHFEWEFSTPTIEDFGIDALYSTSDSRVWVVRCEACGKHQQVRWDDESHGSVQEIRRYGRHVKWIFACWKCGEELNRANGEWVAKHPNRTEVHGYFIPQQIAPRISADQMKREERDHKRRGRLKVFYNFNLARAYSAGETLLNAEILKSRFQAFEDAYKSEKWYLGVDQGDVLHWELGRWYNGIALRVAFGTLTDFDDLHRLMNEFNVVCGVIDAQPNKHSAKKFRDAHEGKIYLCYYKDNQPHEMKATHDDEEIVGTKNKEQYAVTVDRTETLDSSASDWIQGRAMLNAFPGLAENKNSKEYHWITQMVALKRDLEEDKHGNLRGVWKKTGADHWRHADNYLRLAMEIAGAEGSQGITTGGQIMIGFNDMVDNPKAWKEKDGLLIPVRSSEF